MTESYDFIKFLTEASTSRRNNVALNSARAERAISTDESNTRNPHHVTQGRVKKPNVASRRAKFYSSLSDINESEFESETDDYLSDETDAEDIKKPTSNLQKWVDNHPPNLIVKKERLLATLNKNRLELEQEHLHTCEYEADAEYSDSDSSDDDQDSCVSDADSKTPAELWLLVEDKTEEVYLREVSPEVSLFSFREANPAPLTRPSPRTLSSAQKDLPIFEDSTVLEQLIDQDSDIEYPEFDSYFSKTLCDTDTEVDSDEYYDTDSESEYEFDDPNEIGFSEDEINENIGYPVAYIHPALLLNEYDASLLNRDIMLHESEPENFDPVITYFNNDENDPNYIRGEAFDVVGDFVPRQTRPIVDVRYVIEIERRNWLVVGPPPSHSELPGAPFDFINQEEGF